MDFGQMFNDFLPQHVMAEVAKIVDSCMFFIRFLLFLLLGSWVGFLIAFWWMALLYMFYIYLYCVVSFT